MKKPNNYDSINVGNWTPVSVGGHKCVIKMVEELKTKNGLEMLKVSFDMHNDDTQPAYFTNQYLSDKEAKRENLAWRGVQYIVTDESTEYGSANLKRFLTAVEGSNEGFLVQWGEQFTECLKNKKVGIIFRMEDYTKQDGTIGSSAKPFRFCYFDKAFEAQIPEPKKLEPVTPTINDPSLANEGFMKVDPLTDEGLPFK